MIMHANMQSTNKLPEVASVDAEHRAISFHGSLELDSLYRGMLLTTTSSSNR